MSAPAAKALEEPVMTTAPILSSRAMASKAEFSSWKREELRAGYRGLGGLVPRCNFEFY